MRIWSGARDAEGLRRRLVTAEDSKTVRSLLRETFAACDDRCEAFCEAPLAAEAA